MENRGLSVIGGGEPMEIAIVFYIILCGVIIYVLGEIIVKIVIDPVQELKRVIQTDSLLTCLSAFIFGGIADSDRGKANCPGKTGAGRR